jgi:hypothetical protein
MNLLVQHLDIAMFKPFKTIMKRILDQINNREFDFHEISQQGILHHYKCEKNPTDVVKSRDKMVV